MSMYFFDNANFIIQIISRLQTRQDNTLAKWKGGTLCYCDNIDRAGQHFSSRRACPVFKCKPPLYFRWLVRLAVYSHDWGPSSPPSSTGTGRSQKRQKPLPLLLLAQLATCCLLLLPLVLLLAPPTPTPEQRWKQQSAQLLMMHPKAIS